MSKRFALRMDLPAPNEKGGKHGWQNWFIWKGTDSPQLINP